MNSLRTLALASFASASLAGSAAAQLCAGFPTVDGGGSVAARYQTNDGTDAFGVEASYNPRGPLSLSGGLDNISEGGEDETLWFAGVALELPRVAASMGPRVSACPQVGIRYADVESVITITQFPIGFGIGTSVDTKSSTSLGLFVVPQLLISHISVEGELQDFIEDDTETDFGVRGGAVVGFGQFFVRGELEHNFTADGAEPTIGIAAGIRL
jgi:hypothetical protein